MKHFTALLGLFVFKKNKILGTKGNTNPKVNSWEAR